MLRMNHMHRIIRRTVLLTAILATAVLAIASLAACEDTPTAQQNAAEQRQDTYEYLKTNFPVDDPDYSNDLRNLQFWVETWATATNTEGKLAYIYLLSMDGQLIGYYVLDGLPTAKCKMATPTYDFERPWGGNGQNGHMVPAPGLTGTYSGGTGECNVYFGRDALSGSYVEWMAGGGINQLVYDQPLTLPEGVEPPLPLGNTRIEDVQ